MVGPSRDADIGVMPRTGQSAFARLLASPRHFHFDAAMRVLARKGRTVDPAEAARFVTPVGLAYPPAEIAAIEAAAEARPPRLTVGMFGLTGPSGVLPRIFTDLVTQSLRLRSAALHDFLDMLAHRMVAFFAGAGAKYRLDRAAENAAAENAPGRDPISEALLAYVGYATPRLAERLTIGTDPLVHYAGFFSGRPRSAEKLAALVSDWLDRKVEVIQFAGAWLPLPVDQRTALAAGLKPGAWNRLGREAAIGVRAWDPQARIVLRLGPLDRHTFETLLPDRAGLQRLVALVRAFLGFETGFAVNPVLARAEVPPLRLDSAADPAPRLGWNTWVPAPGPAAPGTGPRPDAADAVFEAELVEAVERSAQQRGIALAAADAWDRR
jgi:type VI secretion system protein ImpH